MASRPEPKAYFSKWNPGSELANLKEGNKAFIDRNLLVIGSTRI